MKAWQLAAAGMVSLAVAMGIGRFAFTPLLPMMLAERVVDLQSGSRLATANYAGHLAGALFCTLQPWIWRHLGNPRMPKATTWVRWGLVAITLLTVGMALQWPAAWPALRFCAGAGSAVVLVYTSGWCLSQLAARGVAEMGALIFTGPGIGIVLSGMVAGGAAALGGSSAAGWLVFGVVAALLTAGIWQAFQARHEIAPAAPAQGSAQQQGQHGPTEIGLMAAGYGVAGFGYIITATFLPVIARLALPASPWLDLFWPILGLGVIVGALLASRVPAASDMRLTLALCYGMQAAGIALGRFSPTLAGFVIGSVLLGLPFTAITFFGMQEARRLRPQQAASYIGLLTFMYGLGQILGPPLAAAMVVHSASPAEGFTRSLDVAAAALSLGALLFGWMAWRYPASPASSVR